MKRLLFLFKIKYSKTTKQVSSVLKCVNGNQDTYMESSAPEADVQIPAA